MQTQTQTQTVSEQLIDMLANGKEFPIWRSTADSDYEVHADVPQLQSVVLRSTKTDNRYVWPYTEINAGTIIEPAPPEPPLSERVKVGDVWEQGCSPRLILAKHDDAVVTVCLSAVDEKPDWATLYAWTDYEWNRLPWTLITPAPRKKLADVLPVGQRLIDDNGCLWELTNIEAKVIPVGAPVIPYNQCWLKWEIAD